MNFSNGSATEIISPSAASMRFWKKVTGNTTRVTKIAVEMTVAAVDTAAWSGRMIIAVSVVAKVDMKVGMKGHPHRRPSRMYDGRKSAVLRRARESGTASRAKKRRNPWLAEKRRSLLKALSGLNLRLRYAFEIPLKPFL